ncbi:MAG: methyl-accepting chemotaxis protein [Deltaproteobacteria bacterium]|nr:methyl-accepting chemotaxis protein [Deltaproteobacteria bacterium]
MVARVLVKKLVIAFIAFGLAIVGLALLAEALFDDTNERVALVATGFVLLSGGSIYFARRITRHLGELTQFGRGISSGDLSTNLVFKQPSRVPDEVDDLRAAINLMLDNFRELVIHMQRTSQSVAESANELRNGAEGVNASAAEVTESIARISSGAEWQTELVEKASSLINSIAKLIERTARSAEDASKASTDTSEAASSGSAIARKTIDKMSAVFERVEKSSERVFRFGERSKEIAKIVELITRVAQQTHLLALNATIEAARAGEYGRGFAVVADEVRKLAENVGLSAEQISKLAFELGTESDQAIVSMRESTTDLNNGRAELSAILQSLENITGAATRGADMVQQISSITRDQLRGAQEMVQAIERISGVAVSNATATEQVMEATQRQRRSMQAMTHNALELSNLSRELETVMQRFKLEQANK